MVAVAAWRAAEAAAMSEKELQRRVDTMGLKLVKLGRILYHHTHRPQHSSAGVPDSLFVNPRRRGTEALMYAELKRECACRPNRAPCPNHPSPDQEVWMATLSAVGFAVYLWRPHDLLSGDVGRIVTEFAA